MLLQLDGQANGVDSLEVPVSVPLAVVRRPVAVRVEPSSLATEAMRNHLP